MRAGGRSVAGLTDGNLWAGAIGGAVVGAVAGATFGTSLLAPATGLAAFDVSLAEQILPAVVTGSSFSTGEALKTAALKAGLTAFGSLVGGGLSSLVGELGSFSLGAGDLAAGIFFEGFSVLFAQLEITITMGQRLQQQTERRIALACP